MAVGRNCKLAQYSIAVVLKLFEIAYHLMFF